MLRVFCTTIPGNHTAVLVPSGFSHITFLLNVAFFCLKKAFLHIKYSVRRINLGVHLEVLWTCLTNHIAVSFTAQPGLSVSLAKARQRGWAAKHSAQWHMLCGFLGTGWRTVVLLCQASLYCRGPLAVVCQATREAEKVFHWALIEKTPPWIQQMPVSCIHAQL